MAKKTVGGPDVDDILALHAWGLDVKRIAAAAETTQGEVKRILEARKLQAAPGRRAQSRRDRIEAKRERLREALLDDAMRLRAQLWADKRVYTWTQEGELLVETLPGADPTDQSKIMQAVRQAIQASEQLQGESSQRTAAIDLLGAVADQLGLRDGE